MKFHTKYILIFLVMLFSLQFIYSQGNYKVPKSIFDLGAGVGPNYGLIGGQVVIGYKGTGLLMAAGYFNGLSTYAIGGQLSYGIAFANFGYGVYGTLEDGYTGKLSTLTGKILAVGLKFGLLKSKRLTIQFSGGPGWGAVIKTPFGPSTINGFFFSAGLGFRIPLLSTDKKETKS